MRNITTTPRTLARLLTTGALALMPFASQAQNQNTGYIRVVFADVKPSAQAEFEAVIKEIGAAQRETGHPFMHVYQRIRGDSGYSIFALDADMNGLPQLNLDQALAARVTGALNGIRRVTLEMSGDISIGEGLLDPSGRYMRVMVRTVAPEAAGRFSSCSGTSSCLPCEKAG